MAEVTGEDEVTVGQYMKERDTSDPGEYRCSRAGEEQEPERDPRTQLSCQVEGLWREMELAVSILL